MLRAEVSLIYFVHMTNTPLEVRNSNNELLYEDEDADLTVYNDTTKPPR